MKYKEISDVDREKIIQSHLKNTNSGWFRIIASYTDGVKIEHGTHKRSYIKFIKY